MKMRALDELRVGLWIMISDRQAGAEETGMNALKAVLVVIGLIMVGMIAWWVLKLVFGLVLYLIVGALVVGGAWLLYTRYGRSAKSRRW